MSHDETVAALTGPGGPFELVTQTVGGLEMPVFKNRLGSLRELLSRSLEFGDAEFAVWDNGVRWSFATHERLVASVAAALREKHGVGPGSRIAILASNCPEWMLTAWATSAPNWWALAHRSSGILCRAWSITCWSACGKSLPGTASARVSGSSVRRLIMTSWAVSAWKGNVPVSMRKKTSANE